MDEHTRGSRAARVERSMIHSLPHPPSQAVRAPEVAAPSATAECLPNQEPLPFLVPVSEAGGEAGIPPAAFVHQRSIRAPPRPGGLAAGPQTLRTGVPADAAASEGSDVGPSGADAAAGASSTPRDAAGVDQLHALLSRIATRAAASGLAGPSETRDLLEAAQRLGGSFSGRSSSSSGHSDSGETPVNGAPTQRAAHASSSPSEASDGSDVRNPM